MVALIVITPYIASQLKAVSASVDVLAHAGSDRGGGILGDTAFYVAALMAAFAILYGTRHIDATERHEGMVAAIAFESIVKLAAFLAVGLFVAFVMFDGPAEIFARAAADPAIAPLLGSAGASAPMSGVARPA